MQRKIRSVLIMLVVVAGLARADEPQPKPLTEEQKAKLKERDRLAAEALKFGSAGKLDQMIALLEKKLALERAVFGDVHEEVAASLAELAPMHEFCEDFDAARKARKEVLALRTKLYGEKDWRVTDARLDLKDLEQLAKLDAEDRRRFWEADRMMVRARTFRQQGLPQQQLPLVLRAIALYKESLGEEHRQYAASLNYLGMLYFDMGDRRNALGRLKQTREMRRRLLGEKHPAYATSLNNLAGLYQAMGDYGQALPLFEQARDLRRELLTENHSDYAQSLNNIALLYYATGNYPKALPLFEQARELYKKLVTENDPAYATSLNNLAALYVVMGDYAKALRLYGQARDIFKKLQGGNHPAYAASLNNLALLHQAMGDYGQALPLFEQALELCRKLQTENHPDYATTINNLARLFEDMEEYSKALPLYKQARNLFKEIQGENHPAYAALLDDLAGLYEQTEDYGKALELYEHARDLREKNLTKDHRDYAASLRKLALLYEAMGDYTMALPLHKEARDLAKKLQTENHPDYVTSLMHLALVYHMCDQSDLAAPLACQGLRSSRAFLDRTLAAQSDRQRLGFLRQHHVHLHTYLTCVAQRDAATAAQVYADLLQWKAAASSRRAEELLARDRPDLRLLADQMRLAQASLARMAQITPTTPEQRDDWVKRFDAQETEVERLERALAEKSDAFRRFRELRSAGSADVGVALARDAALVDFVAYQHYSPAPKAKPAYTVEGRLLAFVVRHGHDPVCVPLGKTEGIEEAVLAWRAALLGRQNPEVAGTRLAALVWKPLTKHLGQAKTVLLAPDGPLAFVPFVALPGSKPGTYLLEEVTFGYVTSGRHLLELTADAADRPASTGLLALGGLDYGPRPVGSVAVAVKDDPRGLERGPDVNPNLFLQSAYWKPLPGTRFEAESIVRAYRNRYREGRAPLLLAGAEADTDRLRRELTPTKETPRWRYLHLATHGYFQPPFLKPPGNRPGNLLGFDQARGFRTAERNPLLLSGLVLAGANRTPDQGTLSAQEASALDLRGAELVVLSACDTGLGKVADGEGVVGLQRAFQMAGARTVVASLWKVNDAATSILMEEFYANLWQKKLPKLEALREAQLTVLKNPALVGKRAEELTKAGVRAPEDEAAPLPKALPAEARSPPALWAAFVSYGDPGAEPDAQK
jgi:CHAT domain-containing protein/tetratricopeptide (TPR) repeat protein